MRYIYSALGFCLFLAVLGLTLKNTQPVTLFYYFGFRWDAPLVLVLLIAFCVGAMAGIVASLSLAITQRRRLQALQRELKTLRANAD